MDAPYEIMPFYFQGCYDKSNPGQGTSQRQPPQPPHSSISEAASFQIFLVLGGLQASPPYTFLAQVCSCLKSLEGPDPALMENWAGLAGPDAPPSEP